MKKFSLSLAVIASALIVALGVCACTVATDPPSDHLMQFTNVVLESKTFIYDSQPHSLAVEGILPNGTQIVYENNCKTDVGVYEVTATLSNPNYITKTLTAEMTIISGTNYALSVLSSLLYKPQPWSYLPQAFFPENMAHEQLPVNGINGFSTDVQVSRISNRFIGKQLQVMYEGLFDAVSVLNKIDTVSDVIATIANVYQTFINDNPNDFAEFSGEAAGFKIKIVLDGENSSMKAGNSVVNIELGYNGSTNERTGRLQLTSGIAIKYTYNGDSLKLAVNSSINGVGNLKLIELTRDDDNVVGYIREFIGTETNNLKTSGVISIDDQTLKIISDKRETEDLIINGYEEVYSCATGEMIGGRVQETVKIVNYDTLWLNLSRVSGFDSVRIEDEQNGLNLHKVYVNGCADIFATKKVNPIIPTSSRRFDIEMKEVWYIVENETNGNTAYTSVKVLIPMLFVQTEQASTFSADVKEKNEYINAQLPISDINTVNASYDTLKNMFTDIKKYVTYEYIKTFIGDKDPFFNVDG